MTKQEKRLWLGIAAVVVLILLLLSISKKAGANSIVNNYGGIGGVDIPAFDLPPREPVSIVLPQMPGMPPFDFSMVSSCACGGSSVPYYSGSIGQDINYSYSSTTYDVTQITTQNPIQAQPMGYHTEAGQFNTPDTVGYW